MHILVSNDDGITAPGLRALVEAVQPLGKITVVAPMTNQSSTGHKLTLDKPLRIIPQKDFMPGVEAYAVDGSPADCTAVAMLGFVKEKIDLVVSGINRGPNLAQDVTYSGTVAVALEAAIFGYPAVAFSLDNRTSQADYAHCIPVAREVAKKMIDFPLAPLTIINVNIPAGPEIKGWKVTQQGLRQYRNRLIEREDPHGYPYYWIGGEQPAGDTTQADTDLWAVHHGYVSITPIHLDLTAHRVLPALQSWNTES